MGAAELSDLAAVIGRIVGIWSAEWGFPFGTCLTAQHRYTEAEPLLLRAAAFLEKDRGAYAPTRVEFRRACRPYGAS
jgi:hypothetical protein